MLQLTLPYRLSCQAVDWRLHFGSPDTHLASHWWTLYSTSQQWASANSSPSGAVTSETSWPVILLAFWGESIPDLLRQSLITSLTLTSLSSMLGHWHHGLTWIMGESASLSIQCSLVRQILCALRPSVRHASSGPAWQYKPSSGPTYGREPACMCYVRLAFILFSSGLLFNCKP